MVGFPLVLLSKIVGACMTFEMLRREAVLDFAADIVEIIGFSLAGKVEVLLKVAEVPAPLNAGSAVGKSEGSLQKSVRQQVAVQVTRTWLRSNEVKL